MIFETKFREMVSILCATEIYRTISHSAVIGRLQPCSTTLKKRVAWHSHGKMYNLAKIYSMVFFTCPWGLLLVGTERSRLSSGLKGP